MLIFSLETSYKIASISCLQDNQIIFEHVWQSKDIGKDVLPYTEFFLKDKNIEINNFDYFVVSLGPGSWTGIRLGLSLVLGLSKGIVSRIYGVSCLDSMGCYLQNKGIKGVFLPGNSGIYHYNSFSSKEKIINLPGVFKTGTMEGMIKDFKECEIIAGPDKDICKKFILLKRHAIEIFPKASFNGILAKERITKNIPVIMDPYYV